MTCLDYFLKFYFTYLDLQKGKGAQPVPLEFFKQLSHQPNSNPFLILSMNFIPSKFQVSHKVPKYSSSTSSTVSLASGGRDERGFAVHCRKSVHLVVVYWERRSKLDRQKASFKRKGPQFKHYSRFQTHLYIYKESHAFYLFNLKKILKSERLFMFW